MSKVEIERQNLVYEFTYRTANDEPGSKRTLWGLGESIDDCLTKFHEWAKASFEDQNNLPVILNIEWKGVITIK